MPHSLRGSMPHSLLASRYLLKVGEVADRSGLPRKTVRYYDDIGLLAPTVERSEAGYRLFSADVLNRLAFIRQAQGLGLSLAEIQHILEIRDQGELPCGEIRQHLEGKVDAINQQIQALEALRADLHSILGGWEENPSRDRLSHTICPNLQRD